MGEPRSTRGTQAASGWAMFISPAVFAAAHDRRLQPQDLSVLVALYGELDPLDYRPVKHAWLAR